MCPRSGVVLDCIDSLYLPSYEQNNTSIFELLYINDFREMRSCGLDTNNSERHSILTKD